MHHIVHHIHCNTCITYNKKEIKSRRGCCRLAGWSGHYYLWACCRAHLPVSDRSWVYEKIALINEHENEGTERL
jgi:hypothetical protein